MILDILLACEFSARVRDELRALGHRAYSCDLLPCLGDPRWHHQGDVTPWLNDPWDIVIAFPPCTFIANSGAHWISRQRGRLKLMREGAHFFKLCLNARARIGVSCENPIMCGRAQRIVGRNWDQIVHPWEHGHMVTKKTGLWLRGLPPLVPTKNVYAQMMRLPKVEREHIVQCGANPRDKVYRQRMRSLTFPGIARAMAQQ